MYSLPQLREGVEGVRGFCVAGADSKRVNQNRRGNTDSFKSNRKRLTFLSAIRYAVGNQNKIHKFAGLTLVSFKILKRLYRALCQIRFLCVIPNGPHLFQDCTLTIGKLRRVIVEIFIKRSHSKFRVAASGITQGFRKILDRILRIFVIPFPQHGAGAVHKEQIGNRLLPIFQSRGLFLHGIRLRFSAKLCLYRDAFRPFILHRDKREEPITLTISSHRRCIIF